jgi:4-alpha-glucanotransferase
VKDQERRYFRLRGDDIARDLVRAAIPCPARLAIVPLQDLFNLGAEGRFNTPGAPEHNWEWRFRPQMLEHLHANSAEYLRSLGRLYGRIPQRDRVAAGG